MVIEATRRFFRRPLEHLVAAWDAAEDVWELDDPFLDGWPAAESHAQRASIWD
jgi:hypothetical protein